MHASVASFWGLESLELIPLCCNCCSLCSRLHRRTRRTHFGWLGHNRDPKPFHAQPRCSNPRRTSHPSLLVLSTRGGAPRETRHGRNLAKFNLYKGADWQMKGLLTLSGLLVWGRNRGKGRPKHLDVHSCQAVARNLARFTRMPVRAGQGSSRTIVAVVVVEQARGRPRSAEWRNARPRFLASHHRLRETTHGAAAPGRSWKGPNTCATDATSHLFRGTWRKQRPETRKRNKLFLSPC